MDKKIKVEAKKMKKETFFHEKTKNKRKIHKKWEKKNENKGK